MEMEVYRSADVKSLLCNKFVVIVGDSIQRGIYKDLVLLLQEDRYLTVGELRKKGEYSFLKDELIEGGSKGEMTNGCNYTECRQYATDFYLIRFYFVTRCYNTYVESIMNDLKEEPYPDILIMNSCLWDITRYGKNSIVDYKKNLVTLFDRFKEVLTNDCLVVWNTTLPISSQAKGGFIVPEISFNSTTLRLDVIEANCYVQPIVVEHGFDVFDLHFYMRHHIDKRVRDGIHWDMMAHRYMTNLLLSHVGKAFKAPKANQRRAPFSSYPQQYNGNSLFSDLDSPVFTSSPIRQHGRAEVDQPFYNYNQSALMTGNWSIMSTPFYNCVPTVSQRAFTGNNHNFGQIGWDRWPVHPNAGYGGNDLYRPTNFMFPIKPQFNGPTSSNAYFIQSSFQPYQQHNHQGAFHSRNRNRRKPYNRK